LKRVQQGYGSIELGLNWGLSWATARGAEIDTAESLSGMVVVSLGEIGRRRQEGNNYEEQGEANSHRGSF
jgi:hypothetical protein